MLTAVVASSIASNIWDCQPPPPASGPAKKNTGQPRYFVRSTLFFGRIIFPVTGILHWLFSFDGIRTTLLRKMKKLCARIWIVGDDFGIIVPRVTQVKGA